MEEAGRLLGRIQGIAPRNEGAIPEEDSTARAIAMAAIKDARPNGQIGCCILARPNPARHI
jgi:hypothetical protein